MTFKTICREGLSIFVEDKKRKAYAGNAVLLLGGIAGVHRKPAPIRHLKDSGVIANCTGAGGNSGGNFILSHNYTIFASVRRKRHTSKSSGGNLSRGQRLTLSYFCRILPVSRFLAKVV